MQTRMNKAHTAVANRIARRYGGRLNLFETPDILTEEMAIEVETAATLRRGIRELQQVPANTAYVAVTNKEALEEALRLTEDTGVGVMDPYGNIVRQATPVGVFA